MNKENHFIIRCEVHCHQNSLCPERVLEIPTDSVEQLFDNAILYILEHDSPKLKNGDIVDVYFEYIHETLPFYRVGMHINLTNYTNNDSIRILYVSIIKSEHNDK